MRFDQLNEAEFNFADQAGETIDKVGKLASAARAKFKGAYDKAEGKLKSDIKKSLGIGDGDGDDSKVNGKAKGNSVKMDTETMNNTAVEMLQRPRSPEEWLNGMEDFDANELHQFQNTLELMHKRLQLTPKVMRAALKNFLDAQDRTDDRLNELMSELDDDDADRIETAYMHGNDDSVNALWAEQMNSDDPGERQAAIAKWLRTTSQTNQRKNDAAQGKKQFYVGSGLAKVLRGQLQILDRRLGELRKVAKSAESHSASADKKMTESLTALRTVLKSL